MTENSHIYSVPDMPMTAGRCHLRKIEGDPQAIADRGTRIKELGEKMTAAANRLGLFADGAVGKGESFTAIRDQAQEVHEDLRVAGKRYTPSGTALHDYSGALSTAQSETDWLVDVAQDKWEAVNRASHALSSVNSSQWQYDFDKNHDVERTDERPDSASEQQTFDSAVEASKFLAGRGDTTALILSAVAVIPFGKLAKFASFAKVGKLGELLGGGGRFSGTAKFFGSEFGDFAKGWGEFNSFLGKKIPNLFTVHGLNSQNLMRMLNAPEYIIKNTHLVPGGWAGGWRALAGNPTNLAEAFGGAADIMKNVYYNAYSAKGMFG